MSEPVDISGYEFNVFPCGETRAELPVQWALPSDDKLMMINLRPPHCFDLMGLGQLVDILRRRGHRRIGLRIPYLPYGRQDRYTSHTTSFSLKVYAKFINSLGFEKVITHDAHSDVAGVIDNLWNITPEQQIKRILSRYSSNNWCLLAPDAGAEKKLHGYVSNFTDWNITIAAASKTRNLSTGEITGMTVPKIDKHINKVLVVDDICDGGRTFIELSRKLDHIDMDLYVTHGFFTKPDVFGWYDNVYTTNSVPQQHKASNLNILELQ